MALSVVITVTFSSTQVIVTDTTGNYNASTNPGGYGAPNPAFNTYAHYVVLKKKNVNSADTVLVLDSYNPLTATTFTYERTIDGWYEASKLNIPIWSSGSYVSGNVVEYAGTVYQANTTTSSTPGADGTWAAVIDFTTIIGNSSIITTILGRSTAYNAATYWSNQMAGYTQKGLLGIPEDDSQKERLDNIYTLIQCIQSADQLGDNLDAESNAEGLTTLGAVWNFADGAQF